MAVSAFLAGGATAQTGAELPSIAISPAEPGGPNGGQWFAVEASPGATVDLTAQVTNPAEAEQAVLLYLADLQITDGVPAVGDRAVNVGAWGAFDEPKQVIGPKGVKLVRFHVTVPADAEPGDHLGAVVAESAPSGPAGGIGVIKRVAARLYVTVPGKAKPALEIEKLAAHADGALLPRHATTSFSVRNTGNVRLDVRVTVNGRRADGPSTIVSGSAEPFTARIPLSIWGGRPSITVRVATKTSSGPGPTATRSRDLLIVPWWILLALFLLGLSVVVVRELRRRLR